MLYQLGALTFSCPGPLGADETEETFGHDFAVKPVVGAQQPRESMGPADHKFMLSGTLLPYFHARIGLGSGLGEVATLKSMARGGQSYPLVRGDGVLIGAEEGGTGWWLIERGSLKSSRLGSQGIGNVISYSMTLVESPNLPSSGSLIGLLEQLFA
ncbi:MAG: phage tail protein [Janthinobacterium lividum]